MLALRLFCAAALCLTLSAQTPAPRPSTTPIANATPAIEKVCAGCNYGSMPIAGGDFSNGVQVGTNFQAADLHGANFRNTKIVAGNFFNADLRNVRFDGAECIACNFLGAKLDGATFTGVRMVAANFFGFGAMLDNAQLHALLSGCLICNFAHSNLAGRDLSGATLIQIDFTNADLRNTRFDGATLCRYTVNGTASSVSCDNLQNAQTDGATFNNIQVCENPLTHHGCSAVDSATLRSAMQGSPPPSASPRP